MMNMALYRRGVVSAICAFKGHSVRSQYSLIKTPK